MDMQVTFTIGLTTVFGTTYRVDEVIDGVSEILAQVGVDGFTVTEHIGYWKGTAEKSLSFSVVYNSREDSWPLAWSELARLMARRFQQEGVLLVGQECFGRIVGSGALL